MKILGVRFSCIIIALLLFTGCKTSPVEQVKNGILNDNKSTTIGKSFDNYQYFISPEWKYFETEQGKKIVQFEATVDISSSLNMFKPYAEAIKLKTEILNEESKEKTPIGIFVKFKIALLEKGNIDQGTAYLTLYFKIVIRSSSVIGVRIPCFTKAEKSISA